MTRAGIDADRGGTLTLRDQEEGTRIRSSEGMQSENHLCESPRAAITDDHKLGGLKLETYCLTVLETRSLKSRCWQN